MPEVILSDYFYGDESEEFVFFKIPRQLITNPKFKHVSTDAKLLYGMLLDRMSLSARNGWYDNTGRVYIYYSVDEICGDMTCGRDKAMKLLAELDTKKGIGLIERIKGFEWLMFDQPKERASSIELRNKLGVPLYGNGWPGMKVRWCTGQLKTHLIDKEVSRLKKEYQILHYVGIAADEPDRIKGEQYPLAEWGITEAQALQICYDRGFDWGGLYEIYHRCSCWCCPLQRIDELRKLRRHHPQLWRELLELDERALTQFGHNALGQFKENWTVAALEERFAAEDCELSLFDDYGKEVGMSKEKDPAEEAEAMLRGVPPKNILISFGDTPAKSLEDYMKERKQKKKPAPKKRRPPRSH